MEEFTVSQAEAQKVSTDVDKVGNLLDKLVINDRYELILLIGSGGMGNVYLAKDLKHSPWNTNKVVIKIMSKFSYEDMERFKREAKVCSEISHRNIVKCLGAGIYQNLPFLVLEHIDGYNLKSLLARFGGKLEPIHALRICLGVVKGLEYAYSHGVIHRDIKPENIMLANDGEVKVLDFGISKTKDSSLTNKGGVMGTPGYMSPEQLLDSKNVDYKSDIYSVGLLLYRMISGKLAYCSDNLLDCYKDMQKNNYTRLVDISDDLFDIGKIVDKCLAMNKEERFSQYDEFTNAIKKLIKKIEDTQKNTDKDTQKNKSENALQKVHEDENRDKLETNLSKNVECLIENFEYLNNILKSNKLSFTQNVNLDSEITNIIKNLAFETQRLNSTMKVFLIVFGLFFIFLISFSIILILKT